VCGHEVGYGRDAFVAFGLFGFCWWQRQTFIAASQTAAVARATAMKLQNVA